MPMISSTQNAYPYLPDWAPRPAMPSNTTTNTGDFESNTDSCIHVPNIEGTFTIQNNPYCPMTDLKLEMGLSSSPCPDYSDFENYMPPSIQETPWQTAEKMDQLYDQYFSKLLPEQCQILKVQFDNCTIQQNITSFNNGVTIARPYVLESPKGLESQGISDVLMQYNSSFPTDFDHLAAPLNLERIFNSPFIFDPQQEPRPFADHAVYSSKTDLATEDEKINKKVQLLHDQYFSGIPPEQYNLLKAQYTDQLISKNLLQFNPDGSSFIKPFAANDPKFFNIFDPFFPNDQLSQPSSQPTTSFKLKRLCEIQDLALNESYMKSQTPQKQDFLKNIARVYHLEDQFWSKLLNEFSPEFQPQNVHSQFINAPPINPNPLPKEVTPEELFKIMYVPQPKTYPDLGFFEHKYKIIKNACSLKAPVETAKLALVYPWENFLESNININRAIHDFPYLIRSLKPGSTAKELILGPTDGMNAKISYYTGCLGVLSYLGLQGALLASFRPKIFSSFNNYFEQKIEGGSSNTLIQTLTGGSITERKSALTQIFSQARGLETALRPLNTATEALPAQQPLSAIDQNTKNALEILNLAHEQHVVMAEAIEAGVPDLIVNQRAAQTLYNVIATNRPDACFPSYFNEMAVRKFCIENGCTKRSEEFALRKKLPFQDHHIGTNKHAEVTPIIKNLIENRGIQFDLNDPLNIVKVPHRGGHCKEYRTWYISELKNILEEISYGDETAFRLKYEENIIKPVKEDFILLYKEGWK